jgi:hypothetical protein
MGTCLLLPEVFKSHAWRVLMALVLLTGCSRKPAPPQAPWVPLAQLQETYGPLITVGNHPTPDQHGTGERLGLFRDGNGRIWGLPLTIAGGGALLGCAPTGLQSAKVTDTIPRDATIVGATNEPTGWRGGTGKLELVLMNKRGEIHSQTVAGGEIPAGPVCSAPELPGPPQKLQYYLISPATDLQ